MITPHDLDVAARTIWGEARGENWNGKVCVAFVILNRTKDPRWGDTLADVCKQPRQFSCWNEKDPNFTKISGDFDYQQRDKSDCLLAMLQAIRSTKDTTDGANHYYSDRIPRPDWAVGMKETCHIGRHRFLKG